MCRRNSHYCGFILKALAGSGGAVRLSVFGGGGEIRDDRVIDRIALIGEETPSRTAEIKSWPVLSATQMFNQRITTHPSHKLGLSRR